MLAEAEVRSAKRRPLAMLLGYLVYPLWLLWHCHGRNHFLPDADALAF
jgi:hypothetical protein